MVKSMKHSLLAVPRLAVTRNGAAVTVKSKINTWRVMVNCICHLYYCPIKQKVFNYWSQDRQSILSRVETRIQQYTTISPPMEVKPADGNTLYGTAQDVILVLVHGTDDICRKVKLTVACSGVEEEHFSSLAVAPKRCQNCHY